MNGVHDIGGMNCFGPVAREENEPVFHADWEGRVFALNLASGAALGPIDRARHSGERMGAARYLAATYYERWLAGIEIRAEEDGILTEQEIERAVATGPPPAGDPPPGAEIIEVLVRGGMPSSRDEGRLEPRFRIGDRVRARNMHPVGHTRLPRYVRGHVGTIALFHGTHVFADSNAQRAGENPQPLYGVRFTATELWGDTASPRDHLCIDLWEDYLEPVPDEKDGG